MAGSTLVRCMNITSQLLELKACWYFGGGAAAYFWHYDAGFVDPGTNTSLAILGTLGLDYKFSTAPVNLSIDWVPTFFVNGYGDRFGAGYGALSARYTLK